MAWALLAVLLIAGTALLCPKGAQGEAPQRYTDILRLWHIDSFEGGKGARGAYLDRIARAFEKNNAGVYVLVTVHTAESAAHAVSQGDMPDMLSFGTYDHFAADLLQPLSGYAFDAVSVNGAAYAFPWCRGGYMIFGKDEDFSRVSEDTAVISEGRNAVPALAACLSGLTGDFTVQDPLRAYINFINGKFDYLIGTQRDVFRLKARKIDFYAKPLNGANDLYQYIGICSSDVDTYAACSEFIGYLLSEEGQRGLTSVGMLSAVREDIYDSGEAALFAAQKTAVKKKVKAFLSEDAAKELEQLAKEAMRGIADIKNLEKFLV